MRGKHQHKQTDVHSFQAQPPKGTNLDHLESINERIKFHLLEDAETLRGI